MIDAVPFGDFIPIVFHFTIDEGGRHLGDFTRRIGVRDTYDLDLSGDTSARSTAASRSRSLSRSTRSRAASPRP